ncbi:MAG TPA: PIN domain-containing protein [Thermoanaerobaculia bacterium]|nr:PIN domain-containing protein [Thermoanaerobaculia bacterium]
MAGDRKARQQAPQRLILDSGAVIALARGDQRARAFLARALELGAPVAIPVVVLAETVRGGPRDAPVNRVLRAVGSVPEAREVHGRIAGELLGAARSAETVDALVVAHAVAAGGAHILTGDREDLVRLAALHTEVWVHPL